MPPDKDKIVVDLNGMGLNADEQQELERLLQAKVVEFLKGGAGTINPGEITKASGWIGYTTKK